MEFITEFVFNFWYWWYVEQLLSLLQSERGLLLRVVYFTRLDITLRYFFTPLYKNYSMTGRIFSLIFRAGMLILGLLGLILGLLVVLMINIVYLIAPLFPVVKLWQVLIS